MYLREAQHSDSDDLLAWRNDPATRLASLNQNPVEREGHEKWFNAALANPNLVLYIASEHPDSTESVGMCRFDVSPSLTTAEVSINLNPLFRGKRLSQELLRHSIEKFSVDYPAVQAISATIREENVASLKIFTSEKFIKTGSDDAVVSLVRSLR